MTFMSHSVTPKQVASVFDLGHLGGGEAFRANIIPAKQKEKKHRIASRGKRLQQKPF